MNGLILKDRTSKTESPPDPTTLRLRLVEYLEREGAIRSTALERAFSIVPREIFLPSSVPLPRVYADEAIVVKWDESKYPTSSSTQPYLMADMLETLQLEPGMRVLEIGAGVGYNAAIMAQVLGPAGAVTSLELDPAMAEQARFNLNELTRRVGPIFSPVEIIAADGSLGYAQNAPYDRIIVTVQQWEISPNWVAQLRVGGRIILPLTLSNYLWGGLIPALEKGADGILRAVAASQGGFMPMRGEMAHPLSQTPNNQKRLTRLPFDPAKILPGYEPPEGLPLNAPPARLYLADQGLPDEVAVWLEKPEDLQVISSGKLPLEFKTELKPEADGAKRAIAQAFYGFNMSLSVALRDQLFSLVLATPAPEENNGPQGTPGESGSGWVGEGWRYEGRGVILLELHPEGCDIALLTGAGLAANWRGWLAQGWRLVKAEAGDNDFGSQENENRALQRVSEVWQAWQAMGQPTPAQYRPLAYPSDQLPPVPGYIIPRQYYNLLLPFKTEVNPALKPEINPENEGPKEPTEVNS